MREFRVGSVADDHEQRNPVPHDGIEFIGLVADAAIMCERDPSSLTDRSQPVFIGAIGREVISVFLDPQSSLLQCLREAGAEIAIREEDKRQAACS